MTPPAATARRSGFRLRPARLVQVGILIVMFVLLAGPRSAIASRSRAIWDQSGSNQEWNQSPEGV